MTRKAQRAIRALLALGVIGVGVGCLPGAAGGPAGANPTSSAFTATKTVTRVHLAADGSNQVVESKKVTVRVDTTKNLYGRQDVNVSWSGAQPTGGIQPDPNSAVADQQEYPMALLECRGSDGSASGAQVTPQTCWTHGPDPRYTSSTFAFPPWRLDRYAAPNDRAAVVGQPSPVPASCGSLPVAQHWLPFQAVDGAKYYYGLQSCAGIPPEDFNSDTSQQVVPQNATFAATHLDGRGATKFDIWTEAEDASLGCSATVACTLEIIPIMGVSCDPSGVAGGVPADDVPGPDDIDKATNSCESTGNYLSGTIADSSQAIAPAVSGALWWSPSNWRNRISVPLNLAPSSNACEQVSSGTPQTVYGSETLAEATTQWAPKFCLDPKLFKFTHVQTGEPLAQSLLNDPTSGVHAAFSSLPPAAGFTGPVVQAPVAATGFSISYNVDDDNGNPVANLRLTPRLIAKLLTESYPEEEFDRFKSGQYPYLTHSPYNITGDPEFKALNPGISAEFGTPGAAAMIMLSAESDVTYALTDYLNADPEARAWLNGAPDPWGMVVNPAYKGIALPVLRWPLLDQTVPDFGPNVPCTGVDPTPWLPLVASPTPTLATSAVDVQFAASTGKVACTTLGEAGSPAGQSVQWVSTGRATPGDRFVIGITSLGEARRYDLQSAALQTHSDSTDATHKFTNGAGRTFVGPTNAALAAGASTVVADTTTQSFTTRASALRTKVAAYPGFMLVSADVPTKGLSSTQAADYSKLLSFAAGPGQQSGPSIGQLPAGYLPMTAANNLAAEAAYTRTAADAVAAQKGVVPPLHPSKSSSGGSTPGGHSGTGRSSTPAPIVGAVVGGTGAVTPAGAAAAVARAGARAAAAAAGGSAKPALAAQTFRTPAFSLGFGGVFLPLLFGVGVLGSLLAGASVWTPQRVGRKHRRSR
ncbi:hypothetical protein [uncultured Jatrophihabitans sp.]|uniref:hypothetical protein n=1 Tax=uncultured Jatrophihabitans sp. TaxID=1610747 RepID=UPI0035CB2579